MLEGIEISTQEANMKKNEAFEKSQEVEKQSAQISKEKYEAETILNEALPALDAARKALADLDKSDITEIRSFATPPEPVQIVSECVAILKNLKDISWKGAKGMMADASFLRSLLEMKVELLTSKQINSCKAHLKQSNRLDEMQQISKAGYGLLKFIRAVIGFYDVYREVKPKKDRVDQLVREQDAQINLLLKLNNEIKSLEKKLTDLNKQYTEAIKEKQILTEMMQQAERRLVRIFYFI